MNFVAYGVNLASMHSNSYLVANLSSMGVQVFGFVFPAALYRYFNAWDQRGVSIDDITQDFPPV
jgi:hypothetical protein